MYVLLSKLIGRYLFVSVWIYVNLGEEFSKIRQAIGKD